MLLFHVFTFCSEQKEHLLFLICSTFWANDGYFYGGRSGRQWPENLKAARKISYETMNTTEGKKRHNSGFIVCKTTSIKKPPITIEGEKEKNRTAVRRPLQIGWSFQCLNPSSSAFIFQCCNTNRVAIA